MPSDLPQLMAERIDRVALGIRQRYAAVHALFDDAINQRWDL